MCALCIAWLLLLVAISSSVGNLVVLDLDRYLWWSMGVQLGRSQPRAGLAGKHSRDRTSLFQTSYLPKMEGKRKTTPHPACHAAVETSLPLCLDSPREQSEAKGEDAVMEDGTETHQSEINKKIKANDNLQKILTNMPEEHRTLIYGDSFKSRMESLDDEKPALLAAKRQFHGMIDDQDNVHFISSIVHSSRQEALLYIFEDNEAVIKMIMKGRSPTMKHVPRHHRVALDGLFDRINLDPKIQIKYVETKNQLADMLTKGNFIRYEWDHLLRLLNVMNFSMFSCCHLLSNRKQSVTSKRAQESFSEDGVGSGETETDEFGVKEPPSGASNSPGNQELDQSSVS